MGLGVIRSLGINRIPVVAVYYDKKDMGYVSKYVMQKVKVAHPNSHPKEFLNELISIAHRHPKSVLLPVDDHTISIVSRNKQELDEYFTVACPSEKVTRRFIDKRYTYQIAEKIGIPAPQTFIPQSIREMRQYSRHLLFPCLIKPCESHLYFEFFNKKMQKVWNHNQLESHYLEAEKAGITVMVQEYIPGKDTWGVNYNSYFVDGKALVEFTAEKVRLAPPDTGAPRVVVSKNIPEVVELGRAILIAIGFNGYSCTEFKKDARDGTYKLMEVNGRHNRSSLLALKCGINFPLIEYKYLTDGELPAKQRSKSNIYWIDEYKDFAHSLKCLIKGSMKFSDFIAPYLKTHIFAVFDQHDIKPFIKRFFDLLFLALTYPVVLCSNKRIKKCS